MANSISYFDKIILCLLLFLCNSCVKISITNNSYIKKSEAKKNNKSIKALSVNDNNLFYYHIYYDYNEDENNVDISNTKEVMNYTVIEEGFFDNVLVQMENINDEDMLNNTDNIEDDNLIDKNVEYNKGTEDNIDKNSNVENGISGIENKKNFTLSLPLLKKYLKIKERDRNICHINERLNITPKLTIITNKKQKYSFNFSYKF